MTNTNTTQQTSETTQKPEKKRWRKPEIEVVAPVKRTAGGPGTFNSPGDNPAYAS